MIVETYIRADVHVTYRDLDGVRTTERGGRERSIEWHVLSASASVEDGQPQRIWLTGKGRYVKKDGEVGLQPATMSYGHLNHFSGEWQTRITADLEALAAKVTVAE